MEDRQKTINLKKTKLKNFLSNHKKTIESELKKNQIFFRDTRSGRGRGFWIFEKDYEKILEIFKNKFPDSETLKNF